MVCMVEHALQRGLRAQSSFFCMCMVPWLVEMCMRTVSFGLPSAGWL